MSDNSELEWIRHARQMEVLGVQEDADRARMRPFYLLRPRVFLKGLGLWVRRSVPAFLMHGATA